jgi:hypothetical protein
LKNIVLIILLFVLSIHLSKCYAQSSTFEDYEPASPKIGWDSLKQLIHYPVMWGKAGLQQVYSVSINVDKRGAAKSVQVRRFDGSNEWYYTDSVLAKQLEFIIQSEDWNPAKRKNLIIEDWVYFPIIFYLRNDRTPRALVIDTLILRRKESTSPVNVITY